MQTLQTFHVFRASPTVLRTGQTSNRRLHIESGTAVLASDAAAHWEELRLEEAAFIAGSIQRNVIVFLALRRFPLAKSIHHSGIVVERSH